MREIVLDTETTGLDPNTGHRIVEIGCLELINRVTTGATFQCYVNPQRDMPAAAEAIHGLSAEFLSRHEIFARVADAFLDFIGASPLVIHNAAFDLGFFNAELARLDRAPLDGSRVVDTLTLARRKFPGAQAGLDALCRRFQIDNSGRDLHGALKDARLLADVYLELTGGRQPGLGLNPGAGPASPADGAGPVAARATARPPRSFRPSAEEEAAHAAFLDGLTRPIWRR
jgi:DNA polymerase-3 subunit epsilon